MTQRCDVVIVGAGIAGCAAAIAYARYGLRVILVEAHRNTDAFKRACTHLIQSSAVPTLRRLGLEAEVEAAGGIRTDLEFHTRAGWVRYPRIASGPDATYGYNIRRSQLDPLLRRTAAETDGVRLLRGARVRELQRDGRRVTGVVVQNEAGELVPIDARLTIGADGRHSAVAGLARVRTIKTSHGRFGCFAHYTGVLDKSGAELVTRGDGPAQATSRLWLLDPDIAYMLPNDGRTVLAAMVSSERRDESLRNLDNHINSIFSRLPGGPDLSNARRVSNFTPIKKYQSVWRRPIAPGLALIGDAALVTDYLWGAGIGWALQSSEWITDATALPLVSGEPMAPALRKYAYRHFRRLGLHHAFNANFATGRKMNALERVLFGAATADEEIGARLLDFGSRKLNPLQAFGPGLLARAWRLHRALEAA
ncbi:NAD(P)/FAD-dependent oxidoreductase [Kutzneria sp. CA-103260]|uniref:NAD(P)/FAD-dependent oxidoreductase n=1 Tax=Kutzneria sp. CA-103260 TaxID=2802641 RepID=UPI001BAE3FC6|nr:FAD-dependent oxidoreductase [Kutzneria sp. CA-103260]QUQ72500.1 FAD-dependent oxidoreductase [Kutzneria sp. CA-103260]